MSDPVTKARYSKAKDQRQMPAPDKAPKHRRKQGNGSKPYKIESRWTGSRIGIRDEKWGKWGRYKTLDVAVTTMHNLRRKSERNGLFSLGVEYRVVGPDGEVIEVPEESW